MRALARVLTKAPELALVCVLVLVALGACIVATSTRAMTIDTGIE